MQIAKLRRHCVTAKNIKKMKKLISRFHDKKRDISFFIFNRRELFSYLHVLKHIISEVMPIGVGIVID